MRERLRSLLTYANVMATLAVFLVLSGGTAVALSGTNTVFSDDIVDNEVKTADVRNDTLSGGGLAAADLKPSSVGTSEVAANSLNGGDINESGLGTVPNADQLDGVSSGGFLQTANAVGARAGATGGQVLVDTLAQTIELDTEEFDTGGLYTAPNDSMTIGVAGTYLLSGEVGFGSSNADGQRLARIRVDGVSRGVSSQGPAADALSPTRVQVATIARASAGDAVTLEAAQFSGANLSLANYNGTVANLAVQWLGP